MRKQRAFASLTEREIEQIADWLRSGNYDDVLERVAKPRPEGFGLTVSRKPLQLLWEKTNRVERINNRIASGQRLSLAEFDAINAGEKADLAEEIHDAILDETHAMATSGENTPTQLLALQRLADFPARAEYREHQRQLALRKEELNLRKEERDQEKQAHKVQMDLQKSAHKIQMDLEKAAQKKEMDEHRKHMAEERLALSQKAYELRKRSLDLREKALEARAAKNSALSTPNSALEDDLGPLATTYEEIRARARAKFGSYKNGKSRGHEPHETSGSCEPSLPSRPSVETPASSPASDPCSSVPSAVKTPSVSLQPSLNELAIQSSNNPSIPSTVGSSAPPREINILPVTNTNNEMNHQPPPTYENNETNTVITQSPGSP